MGKRLAAALLVLAAGLYVETRITGKSWHLQIAGQPKAG